MIGSNVQLTSNNTRPGIAARALISGIAGALLGLAGCAVEPDDTTSEPEIVEYQPEVLGKVNTSEGVQLTFTAEYEHDDGDPVVAITELVPRGAPSYLERLRGLGATSLEAFLAVASEGAEVPAVLRDAHVREATLLDRPAEVRELSRDIAPPLATFDSDSCDSFSKFKNSVLPWFLEQTSSSNDNHMLRLDAPGTIYASMCNYDSNRVDYKYAQFCVETNTTPVLFACDTITVPDGHRVNRSWPGATSGRRVGAKKLANYPLTVTSYIAIGYEPAK